MKCVRPRCSNEFKTRKFPLSSGDQRPLTKASKRREWVELKAEEPLMDGSLCWKCEKEFEEWLSLQRPRSNEKLFNALTYAISIESFQSIAEVSY